MMQSLVVDGLQCGAFPHWVDGSDDSTPMAGDNALNVIAGAYKFGATDFDLVGRPPDEAVGVRSVQRVQRSHERSGPPIPDGPLPVAER